MTLEGHGPPGEEAPAPPALTRWSDEAVDEEADLLPPYVPGGVTPRRSTSAPTPRPPATGEDDRTPIEATPAAPTAEPEPAEPVVNAFPFDMPSAGPLQDEPPARPAEPEAAIPAESATEPEPAVPAESVTEREARALADRLDRLADALRREGRRAVERELADGDRVSALVAGVLAGYLAGLED